MAGVPHRPGGGRLRGRGGPGRDRPGCGGGGGESASCASAEIIGVHGTGEGPSATDHNLSPEIKATFAAFTADTHKPGKYGMQLVYCPYPVINIADYLPTAGRRSPKPSTTTPTSWKPSVRA
jgi:hypothetical protein